MPKPGRLYPPVVISKPPSEKFDEGYSRIFGSEPRGPLAKKLAEEAKQTESVKKDQK